jgi:hypothetical protein
MPPYICCNKSNRAIAQPFPPTAYNEIDFILFEAIVIVKPTQIELPETLNLALEHLAHQTGRSPLELIQEAIEIYLFQQNSPLSPSIGMGASGRNDLSQQDEELLWQDRWLTLLPQVAESEQNYATGNIHRGSVADLMADLRSSQPNPLD